MEIISELKSDMQIENQGTIKWRLVLEITEILKLFYLKLNFTLGCVAFIFI